MATLSRIEQKINKGIRLNKDDALALARTADLHTLGELAAARRRALHGTHVYFGSTLNLNPTNICELRCPLCAFSRDAEDDDAYFMTLSDVGAYLMQYRAAGLTEVHIVGGLSPRLDLSYFCAVLDLIRDILPHAFVQGFTAVEVAYLAAREEMPPRAVLRRLQAHGLDSLPGGGAEIFAPRVRALIAPDKLSADGYLEIHRIAHDLGFRTNITMLYGHVETVEERIDHMLAVRRLQDDTGGVVAFVPLAFHAGNTKVAASRTGGIEDLRLMAVARLVLDNVPHLRCLWNYLGIKMAQVAINFGADDLGSTSLNERIGHAAGARPQEEPSRGLLTRAVRELGLVPVETDSGYRTRISPVPGASSAGYDREAPIPSRCAGVEEGVLQP